MNLHGWRQLAEWSITYSCLTGEEKREAKDNFSEEWESFCAWIITKYSDHADSLR